MKEENKLIKYGYPEKYSNEVIYISEPQKKKSPILKIILILFIIMSIFFAVIIFGLLVFIHEFGHFIIAKKNGVRVVEFSIGMGPKLFGFEKILHFMLER